MNTRKVSLFEAERMTLEESIELTIASLQEYGERHRHWAIAFSGGKDSSAVVTLVAHLIRSRQVPAPESLHIVYADTGLELPALHYGAMRTLEILREMDFTTRVVRPALAKRFFVMMFGRGVPPPHNGLRWCTGALKVDPMEGVFDQRAVELGLGAWGERNGHEAYLPAGADKLLLLTGVRVGESAARDQRIAISCSRNGAECGQGWFEDVAPAYAKLSPLLHWRVCHVWDWLTFHAAPMGFPTSLLAEVYGGDEKEEINARTGCVQCNVAHRDVALDAVLKLPEWSYLQPLTRLLPLYAELSLPHNRLRKIKRFLGPLTMEARRCGLDTVLGIQQEINAAARLDGRPEVSLIDEEELSQIETFIAANTWPDKWTGEEARGDAQVAWDLGNGASQPWLLTDAKVHA